MRPSLRRFAPLSLLVFALGLGCQPRGQATQPAIEPASPGATATADPWESLGEPAVATIEAHLRFLADDAQEGRAPGTAADLRVQEHIEAAMVEFGLEPAFAGSYRQRFEVTDGIRLRPDRASTLTVGRSEALPHRLVPFGHDTAGDTGDTPVSGRLVYVGRGIAGEGSEGDYEGVGGRLSGAIAVILATPSDDPHLRRALSRPQSRVIAARDRGAVAAILVDPELEVPYPNHGSFSDLQIPVVSVGKADAPRIWAALGTRGGALPKPGDRSRWEATLATPIEPIRLSTANVGGILRGAPGASQRVVIGAHMDHLGFGTSSSLAPGVNEIHNGADDNASGVATILALAEALAAIPAAARPYDLVFYAFGAEEMGLLGSKHLTANLSEAERGAILAMLNFDMVGRLREETVIVAGAGTSSLWPELLERSRGGLTVKTSDDGYGASDQSSFYELGIPVLHFFTGPHDDYHRPSDDIDTIDFSGAAAVGGVALRLVAKLLRERPELGYIKVERSTSARGGFRVSLGTIPDYAAEVDGVKLSGVRPGGPAEQAGLAAGDVIIKLGEREIHNLDDFMATFGVLKPEVAVPVVVRRGGTELEVELTPAAPSRR